MMGSAAAARESDAAWLSRVEIEPMAAACGREMEGDIVTLVSWSSRSSRMGRADAKPKMGRRGRKLEAFMSAVVRGSVGESPYGE